MNNGMIIAQSGTPVEYSEDYQRVIDTRWKPVGIVKEYDIDISIATNSEIVSLVKILDHNLGYVPAFVAPRQTDYLTPSPQSSLIGAISFYADDTSIYYLQYNGITATVKGKFYLYDFPINVKFSTGYRGTTLGKTAVSDYGVKISNTQPRFSSNDDFAINTNFKNLSLAEIGFARSVVESFYTFIDVYYDIPYPPLIKVSRQLEPNQVVTSFSPLTYLPVPKEMWSAMSLADNNAFVNAGTIGTSHIYVAASGLTGGVNYAYVILRDPVDVAA